MGFPLDELVRMLSLKDKEVASLRRSLIREKKENIELLGHTAVVTARVEQLMRCWYETAQKTGTDGPAAVQPPKEASAFDAHAAALDLCALGLSSARSVQAVLGTAMNAVPPSSGAETLSGNSSATEGSLAAKASSASSFSTEGSLTTEVQLPPTVPSQPNISSSNEDHSVDDPISTHPGPAFNTVSIANPPRPADASNWNNEFASYEIFFKTPPDDWVGPSGFDLNKTGIIFEDDTMYYLIYQAVGPSSTSIIPIAQPDGHVDYIRTATEAKKGGQIGSYFLWEWEDYKVRRLRGDLTLKSVYPSYPERANHKPWCYPLMVIDWLREEIQVEIKKLLKLVATAEGDRVSDWELREKFFKAVEGLIETTYDEEYADSENEVTDDYFVEPLAIRSGDDKERETIDVSVEEQEEGEEDEETDSSVSGSSSIEIKTEEAGYMTAAEEKRWLEEMRTELAKHCFDSMV